MNRKFIGKRFRLAVTILLSAPAFLIVPSAHGALIGITKGYPDINQASTDINNVFVNTDATHVWRMTINGSNATAPNTDLVTQNIQWFSGDVNHNVCASNVLNSSCTYSPYTLIAYFDAAGNFTTGSVTVDGYIDGNTGSTGYQPDTTHGLANTGSLLDATITKFGFSGTTGTTAYDNLQLDFLFLFDSTSADLNQLYGAGSGGGVIWNGRVQTGQVNGVWTQSAFATAFSCSGVIGCSSTMDTFVPIPAAVWLFGSGLAGLVGFSCASRRRRSA